MQIVETIDPIQTWKKIKIISLKINFLFLGKFSYFTTIQ